MPLAPVPAASDGDGVALAVPEPVGDGLGVGVVGVGVGLDGGVGVAVGVKLGSALGAITDGADAGELAVPDAPGEGQPVAAVPDGFVFGCRSAAAVADDTAAAIRELERVAVGWHCGVAVAPPDTVLRAPLGPVLVVLWAPFVSGPPPPFPEREPLPSVPAPPDGWPPVRFELTCTTAWRSGGIASVTVAMKRTPASTATGRSQLASAARLPPSRQDSERSRDSERSQDSEPSRDSEPGHVQCPRHTQYRARVRAPLTTLSSHGCGGRFPVLARIRSRPSAEGSTALAAADSSRRSAASRFPSGTVIPSPACPPPGHDVSSSRIDLSAAIARAV